MPLPKLKVVFNYRSPFCALIVDELFALKRLYRVDIDWCLVKEVPRPSSLPITQQNPRFPYNRQDCERRARWRGLEWSPPEWRLTDVSAATHLGLWLLRNRSELFEAYTVRVSRAYWSHGKNISDAATVEALAREVGVTDGELDAAKAAAAVIERELAGNAAWCDESGVLGVPFFVVDGEKFWGSDRVGALKRYLNEAGYGSALAATDGDVLFNNGPAVTLPVAGREASVAVNRIFCVGRNYSEHAREMGVDPTREAPFFFMKPLDALVPSGAHIPYPLGTSKYEYEMELVVVLGEAISSPVTPEEASRAIFGYAAGLDMTRRDLQLAARDKGRPWELGKAFERSAVLGPIKAAEDLDSDPVGQIVLRVNDDIKQNAKVADMIWSVQEIVSNLSQYYYLRPGDVIFTGTPAGVGPVVVGDKLQGEIADVGRVEAVIVPRIEARV
ncbi:fumarylacetoacetate hydrolase family protein [Mesorhizobium retamae]|uniref:fumarylacetoacetate hydrolase family protein n=1 Tax=Mesorhizobium retamae TaxID=2912854 RepID=UPI0023B7B772|nr:fumarylacetoacetate hydrolase family protein [Mesorhizobium sp. IRAMC:0171]